MDPQLIAIHDTALRILSEVGFKLHDPEVLELVRSNGVRTENNVVYFTSDQIMTLIKKAPDRFILYARNPEYDIHLGGARTYFAAGYGAPFITLADGSSRAATIEDYLGFLKLIHQIPFFFINGGPLVQPTELTADQSFPAMAYACLLHSDKCLVGMTGHADQVRRVMELIAIAFGGVEAMRQKPVIVSNVNTTSPLQLDRMALHTMKICAEYGQPIIISPGPIAGATGPITLAGNIALGNAEALAGIAIFQLMAPGTPAVYGLQATTAEMRTGGVSIGSPGFSLETSFSARLAKMYGLPCRGGGASTDAKGVSVQSGYEAMLAMFVSYQEEVNLVIHGAGILDAYGAMSYEQFFVDVEIIRMLEYFRNGMRTDPDTLAFDVVKAVGPGGQFLSHPHTMKHCRIAPWMPNITARGGWDGTTADQAVLKNIQKEKTKYLAAYQRPEMDSAVLASLNQYMDGLGFERGFLDAIGGR